MILQAGLLVQLSLTLLGAVIGAILGVWALLWFIPRYFPPKIDISPEVAYTYEGGAHKYRIKIKNKTNRKLVYVNAEMQFLYRNIDENHDTTQNLNLVRDSIPIIARYDRFDENFEYTYRFVFESGQNNNIHQLFQYYHDCQPRLRFRVIARHSISGIIDVFPKEYIMASIVNGNFVVGDTFNITPN